MTKKYLTIDYINILCVGILRFSRGNDNLINIGNFISYFMTTKEVPNKTISTVYETDHAVYIKIFGIIIDIKIISPNITLEEIKQYLIDKLENSIDANTFVKVCMFINRVIDNVNATDINNSKINIEFDKLLKFILLNKSLGNMTELYNDFYSDDKMYNKYDSIIANVFTNYENSLINNDIILTNSVDDIDNAFISATSINQECRTISFLKGIKFIEKKRIAIFIGASGVGKSMILCHCASEYMTKRKDGSDTKLIFYFTFENSREETFIRIIANMLRIPIDDVKVLCTNPQKRKLLIQKYLQLKDENTILIIVELQPSKHTMSTLEAIIDKTLNKYNNSSVYCILNDYVDKMLARDRTGKRTDEQLGSIVDDFKALTKTYNTSGITVSQYNRGGVKKSKEDQCASGTDMAGGYSKYENADIVINMNIINNTVDELGYSDISLYNEKHRYYKDGTYITCIYKPQMALFIESDNDDKMYMPTTTTKKNNYSKDNTPSSDFTNDNVDLVSTISIF